jgi:hypothetical protein
MLVRESQNRKNEGVGSIPLPSFKTIGIIALIIIIWLTWDSGNTESTSVPFYTTWWFWTLVVLFILSTTFLIWNFVSKKKKQEKLKKDKEKNRNHDDNHTDPEVEKHTNDDHAHHGDTWSSKIAVWLIGLGWIIGGIIAFCIVIHLFIPERYTVRANQLVSFEKKKSGLLYVTSSEKIRLYIPDGRTFIVYPNGGGSALERSSGLTGDGDQRDVSALPKGIYKIEGLEGTATVYRAEDWYHKSMAQLLTLWW